MQVHADALAAKGYAFSLQPHLLFEAGFPGQANVATGAEDAVPGESARRAQRPYHLPRGAGKSGGSRDLAIGRDLAFGDLQDDGADLGEHAFRINEPIAL